MTIATTSSKVIGRGNGVTTAFPYAFLIPDAGSLRVSYIDAAGVITVLASSQYTVSGIGAAGGGTVTYPLSGSPIAAGTSIVIERVVPYTQTTRLTNQGGYYPAVVEGALDNLAMQIQQLASSAAFALAITFPSVDVAPVTVLPPAAARAGLFLAFDGSGNPTLLPATGMPGDLSPYSSKASGAGSSRTMASRFADEINVKDEGATGDGVTAEDASFQGALNRLTSGSTLRIPIGTYKLTAGVSRNLTGLKNVSIVCEGVITLGNAVTTGIFITGGENVNVQLSFANGGSAAGQALMVKALTHGTIDVYGTGLAGTLINVAGKVDDLTHCNKMDITRIAAQSCKRAYLIGDATATNPIPGFGLIRAISDYDCTDGSTIVNANDVNILHIDNHASATQVYTMTIDRCGSLVGGMVGLGGSPSSGLLKIVASNRISFQRLYMLSETANVINGLYIDTTSYVRIVDLQALFFNKAIEITNTGTSSLRVLNGYWEGNTVDVREVATNRTMPLVSSYDSGGGTIETANRIINLSYKLGFRCSSGRYPYFTQQADNFFVFYGVKSDGSTFGIFDVLMDQATAQPITFLQILKVQQGAGAKLIFTPDPVEANGVSIQSTNAAEGAYEPFAIVGSELRIQGPMGTWTASADGLMNGYFTWKDGAGNARKIPTMA